MEMNMNSVERIEEYIQIDQEELDENAITTTPHEVIIYSS
jgi:hypothetical protein